ncbi:MAG TPA: metallophosphoesterase [Thermoanaerobaculia bacterium]|nr:metallophosphoesterase [Thermoanaerobaculia bacterium]
MRRLFLLLLLVTVSAVADTKVTLLHFSDYHSHALPFYTDRGERGGIARAVGYLARHKRRGALVFSGGDMVNKGAPAWSDKYRCAEWPWLNGILDAMAFGNHDADYGLPEFEQCREQLRYPVLSANTAGFKPYRVFQRNEMKIGVFALAGSDFPQLVKVPGLTFSDPVAAARETVRKLREDERADAVVMIGHQHSESDREMAKSVPGIDLILGSHSHLEHELTQIPGTNTWFISPGQYLTYISWIELHFAGGKLAAIDGALVPVDARMPEDRTIATRVAKMQRELENDPQYSELFVPIGSLDAALSVEALATRTLEIMRSVARAEIALSTRSSFRRPLAAGTLTLEALRGAMPYENEIIACTMPGTQLQQFLKAAGEESYVSGPAAIDPARNYRVATTDYVAYVAYKDVFLCEKERTGAKVREELRKRIGQAPQ